MTRTPYGKVARSSQRSIKIEQFGIRRTFIGWRLDGKISRSHYYYLKCPSYIRPKNYEISATRTKLKSLHETYKFRKWKYDIRFATSVNKNARLFFVSCGRSPTTGIVVWEPLVYDTFRRKIYYVSINYAAEYFIFPRRVIIK